MSFSGSIVPSWQYKQLQVVLNPIAGVFEWESLKGGDSVVISDVKEYEYEDYLSALSSLHHRQGSCGVDDILWLSLRVV